MATVNEPPWGELLEGPGLADWMWKKALSVFGGRGRRMGIVLQFLLGIKQVEVLKIPLDKNQGSLQACGTTVDFLNIY